MVILFNEMDRVVGDQAMQNCLCQLNPDRAGRFGEIGKIGVNIVIGHPNIGDGVGICLDHDPGADIIVNGIGRGV